MVKEAKPSVAKFLLLGMLIAALEEFITQGVLKNNLVVWIIPTIIAFLPFLIIMYFFGKYIDNKLSEWKANLAFYSLGGFIGLMFEWFIIGLVPWGSDQPIIMLFFQLGMFSFWGSVAFIPRLLMNKKEEVVHIRKWCKRFFIGSFLLIYFIALTTTPEEKRFVFTIAVVILTFLLFNIFYYKYIKILKKFKASR